MSGSDDLAIDHMGSPGGQLEDGGAMKMQSLNFQARPWHVDQMQCFHAFERMSTQFQFQPSPIVAGVWRLHRWGLDKAGIVRWIEETLDLGITTFDHADVYGGYTVEALFGQALKASPGLRHRAADRHEMRHQDCLS